MRLLFFGTSDFAVPTLEALAARHDVVGVVTQPDRPAGRGKKPAATPVKRAAEALGLRVFTPERLVPFAAEARAQAPDAFVVASYGRIVSQALLDLVPVAFNVHPSLLPLYRGATPLQSALRDGRTETGVTIIAMDAGMDTGDVLLQERVPVGERETYGELHDRTARIGAQLAAQALDRYADGTLARTPQRDVAQRLGVSDEEIANTATRPWSKRDWELDPACSSAAMVNLVRALAPEPGARFVLPALGPLRILAAHADDEGPGIPSASDAGALVYSPAGGVWIRSAGGWVAVERLVPPGRGAMSAREFVSGFARHLGPPLAAPARSGA